MLPLKEICFGGGRIEECGKKGEKVGWEGERRGWGGVGQKNLEFYTA